MALLWVLLVSTAFAAGPIVSNVEVVPDQASKKVDISYRVDDSDSASVYITVDVSTNGGVSFGFPAVTFLDGSEVGWVATDGRVKQARWDAGTDWPNRRTDGMRIRVTAGAVPGGMELIPAGTNSGCDPEYGPYSLTVDSFYMDAHEITKALWDDVRNWSAGNGYSYDHAGGGKTASHPVHEVSWHDCVKWCNARSQKEGLTPAYYIDPGFAQIYKTGQVSEPYVKAFANGYRLPTVDQRLYAARGGVTGRLFPWGDTDTIQHARANYFSDSSVTCDTSPTRGYHPDYDDGGYPYTSPVGRFSAGKNEYGLYEMAGNVSEWCYDWTGADQIARILIGGAWCDNASMCRVAYRGLGFSPSTALDFAGLRTVRLTRPYPSDGDPSASDWVVVNERWIRNFYADGAITMSDRQTRLMWVYNAAASGLLNHGDGRNYCDNLVYGGHDDWAMPDRYQLQPMYLHKSLFINVRETLGSAYDWYWSSTGSYAVHMANGALGTAPEYNRHWIWPCRAF